MTDDIDRELEAFAEGGTTGVIKHLRAEVAALTARLAEAERERDAAIVAEDILRKHLHAHGKTIGSLRASRDAHAELLRRAYVEIKLLADEGWPNSRALAAEIEAALNDIKPSGSSSG